MDSSIRRQVCLAAALAFVAYMVGAVDARAAEGPGQQLINTSLDGLFAAGGSTADSKELPLLQGGGHDPKQRGFTVQNVELSVFGAVDPYFNGESHIVFGLSGVELEEAFLTTQALPYGFQLQAGQFQTAFGRINPRHPHQWDWQDQPIINTRVFGEDGMRGTGFRLGWFAPTPWYSLVHFGMQNATGEQMPSMLGADGVTVGGRPVVERSVRSVKDFTYLARWVNFFDISDAVSLNYGISGTYGPNNTGPDGKTYIYGTDLLVKWRPSRNFRGWPSVTWQTEVMGRTFDADQYAHPTGYAVVLPARSFRDWGFHSEVLYGFAYPWSAGIRAEYATGSGEDPANPRTADPMRADRYRVSPLVVYNPTHFSRFRLQYNFDHTPYFASKYQHSVWLGMEFMFGAHPAHDY